MLLFVAIVLGNCELTQKSSKTISDVDSYVSVANIEALQQFNHVVIQNVYHGHAHTNSIVTGTQVPCAGIVFVPVNLSAHKPVFLELTPESNKTIPDVVIQNVYHGHAHTNSIVTCTQDPRTGIVFMPVNLSAHKPVFLELTPKSNKTTSKVDSYQSEPNIEALSPNDHVVIQNAYHGHTHANSIVTQVYFCADIVLVPANLSSYKHVFLDLTQTRMKTKSEADSYLSVTNIETSNPCDPVVLHNVYGHANSNSTGQDLCTGIVFVLTKYVSVHNPVFLETHTIPRIFFGYSKLKYHSEKWSLKLFVLSRQKSCFSPKILNFRSSHCHLLMVILLSGQIELNPGPGTTNSTLNSEAQYPCGVCKDNVDEDARAILCDKCELWYHTQCIDSDIDYSAVANLTSFS